MILVVGGIKGGSGKTTLATNLTVLRSQEGHQVLLVDADEQKSASDWLEQRINLGMEAPWTTVQLSGRYAHKEITKLANPKDSVIIDVGGRDVSTQRSVLSIADVFLIPFRPKSFDVWTSGKVNEIVSEVNQLNPNIKCYAVINQADATGPDNDDAFEALSECVDLKCLPVYIGYRKAFSSAAAKGLGITELKPADKKAVKEMTTLYQAIYS
jgi:chromosome partitioning protein